MNPLHRLVRSKSVSLVGPATNILDGHLGEEIDRSDVVIRVNSTWPSCGNSQYAQRDIGHRTDVLAIDALNQKDSRNVSKILDLKLVVWFNYSEECDHLIPIKRFLRIMRISEMNYEDRFEIDNDNYYMYVLMVLALIQCRVSSMFLCGITLDSMSNAKVINDLINTDKRIKLDQNLSAAILI